MKITFIATGGTIDKDYAPSAGTYNFEISTPAVKRVLETINPNFDFEIKSILKKDSLGINEKDRKLICDTCIKSSNNKIIITHGTDTMTKTAKVLEKINDKTIVLVGSSKPERFTDSDAQFNVGVAVGVINCLDKGIYITMNGRVYNYNECRKDQDTGQFIFD